MSFCFNENDSNPRTREPRSDRVQWTKKGARKGCAVTQWVQGWFYRTKQELMLRTAQRGIPLSPPEKTTCFDKSFFQLYLPLASYIA